VLPSRISKSYGSYDELLADPDIDAVSSGTHLHVHLTNRHVDYNLEQANSGSNFLLQVYVGLPNGLHGQWARKALEAGKHVSMGRMYRRGDG
jgi:hypothetical protein